MRAERDDQQRQNLRSERAYGEDAGVFQQILRM